jgi:hypothetical protein
VLREQIELLFGKVDMTEMILKNMMMQAVEITAVCIILP